MKWIKVSSNRFHENFIETNFFSTKINILGQIYQNVELTKYLLQWNANISSKLHW